MKISLLLLILVLITQPLLSQNNKHKLFTLEYHYGINANAYTFDDIAKPFLDEGLGRNYGFDINFFLLTKKEHLIQFSGNISTINFATSPSNLIYEFGYNYDDDCCMRLVGFYPFTGGIKYLFPFYETDKLKVLGGIGANINVDIGTTAGWLTYEGRRLWSNADNKRSPAIFPSFDLSTRLIYHLTDKFLVTSNISLTISVFPGLHFGLSLLAPITLISKEHPELFLITSALSFNALNIPVATLPHPHMPIFNDFILFP